MLATGELAEHLPRDRDVLALSLTAVCAGMALGFWLPRRALP